MTELQVHEGVGRANFDVVGCLVVVDRRKAIGFHHVRRKREQVTTVLRQSTLLHHVAMETDFQKVGRDSTGDAKM